MTEKIHCPKCNCEYDPIELLNCSVTYWPDLSIINSRTPCCNEKEEIRIKYKVLERGYVYATGSPHFSSEQEFKIEGLDYEEKNDGIEIKFKGKAKFIPNVE